MTKPLPVEVETVTIINEFLRRLHQEIVTQFPAAIKIAVAEAFAANNK